MGYACPHCQKDIADAMPKHRFDEENTKAKEAQAALAKAQAALTEAQKTGAISEQLARQLQEAQAALAAKDATHARELAFTSAGLTDPSVREVFGLHFDRQAAAGEKDAARWLHALAADPGKAPPVLAALLPKPGGAPAVGRSALPDTSGGKAPAGAPPAFTLEQIKGMSHQEFQKNYAAIVASNPDMRLPPALPWGDPPKAA